MGLIASVGTDKKLFGGLFSNLLAPTGGGGGDEQKQKGFLSGAITLPITDVLSGILKGINKLVQFSPELTIVMKQMNIGMRFMLRPIGDVLSNFLRPWILRFNRVAFTFYKDYQEGGLWTAMWNAGKNTLKGLFGLGPEEEVTAGKIVKGIPEAAKLVAGVVITGAIIKGGLKALAGWLFGSGAAGLTAAGGVAAGGAVAGGIMIPLLIGVTGFALGKAFGFDDLQSIIIGAVGITSFIVFGPLGPIIAIPLTLLIMGIMKSPEVDKQKDILDNIKKDIEEGMVPDLAPLEEYYNIAGRTTRGLTEDIRKRNEEISNIDIFNIPDITDTTLTKYYHNWLGENEELIKNITGAAEEVPETIRTWGVPMQNVTKDFVLMDKRAINVNESVNTLNTSLNALPNIDRTITYTVVYRNEGEARIGGGVKLPSGGTLFATAAEAKAAGRRAAAEAED